jgi:hypothetical protein
VSCLDSQVTTEHDLKRKRPPGWILSESKLAEECAISAGQELLAVEDAVENIYKKFCHFLMNQGFVA